MRLAKVIIYLTFLLIFSGQSVLVLAQEKPKAVAKNQTVILKGKVTDAITGEAIPFANVVVKQYGSLIAGAACDFEGIYEIKIDPAKLNGGPVDVELAFVGYIKKKISGITLSVEEPRLLNAHLLADPNYIPEEIITITVPFYSEFETGIHAITPEEIRRSPSRDINEMLQTRPFTLGF